MSQCKLSELAGVLTDCCTCDYLQEGTLSAVNIAPTCERYYQFINSTNRTCWERTLCHNTCSPSVVTKTISVRQSDSTSPCSPCVIVTRTISERQSDGTFPCSPSVVTRTDAFLCSPSVVYTCTTMVTAPINDAALTSIYFAIVVAVTVIIIALILAALMAICIFMRMKQRGMSELNMALCACLIVEK